MNTDTKAPRGTGHRWWSTADTASAAAGQLVVWIGLLAVSVFAVTVEPGLGWWVGICAWTIGLVASTATLLARCEFLPRRRRRPPLTSAGAFTWGLGTAALGAVAVTALVVFISTGSGVFVLATLLTAAGATLFGAGGYASGRQR